MFGIFPLENYKVAHLYKGFPTPKLSTDNHGLENGV